MKTAILILKVVLAVVIGEVILVLGTTIAQDYLVDGVYWETSGIPELIIGGGGSILAAVLSGMVAYRIVSGKTNWPLIILSVLVAAETAWLISTDRSANPMWFSILSGIGLIFGFWLGKSLINKYFPKTDKFMPL